jgi:3-hydroxyisobutyrate dehydrogenase
MNDESTSVPTASGVIGLGRIGAGVARCVSSCGFETWVFDVDTERLEPLATCAHLARSNRELADAVDIVFVAVFDDAQLRRVLAGPGGVLEASDPPRTIVILSTVSLDTIRWAAAEAGRRGIDVLDCGVAGGKGLEAGSIVSMVGGDAGAFATARPVLESFSEPLLHMGPLGSGMQAKLARNMMHYCLALVAREGGRLAAAAGIDGEQFVQLVRARDEIGPGFYDFLRLAASGGHDPATELPEVAFAEYAAKDLAAALELAEELHQSLPVAEHASDLFTALLPQRAS